MKVKDLLDGVKAILTDKNLLDKDIASLCFDSRKVEKGSMFFCIPGERMDGHAFAPKAAEMGAAVIVAEHVTTAPLPHILVDDARRAMFYICANFYGHPERDLKLIGVTGTNGKTSTTSFIKELLDAFGKKTGLMGTVCNMIGDEKLPSGFTTPEPKALFTLLSKMKAQGVEYVVMEISSHALAQHRVCGLTFEVGVFSNLTQDHLDFHGTLENYKNAKRKLFLQSKTCVLNIDDPVGAEFAADQKPGVRYLTYSAKKDTADIVAKNIKLSSDGVDFLLLTAGQLNRVHVGTPGKFTVYNATAAVGALYAAGFDFSEITAALGALRSVDGRAQIVPTDRDFTVMIDYAHTPDALENILNTVRSYAKGRVITLFGCGGDRDKTKRPIMGHIAAKLSDVVIVTSDNPRTEDPGAIIEDILPGVIAEKKPYTVIENRKEAIAFALKNARRDDIVLLAGKGHEKYQILAEGKIDFDEQAIVLSLLKDMKS